jgi:nucleoside-diphosphate-sugar epimerase
MNIPPQNKCALVTGATGVVGRNLIRHLNELAGWEVIGVSRRKPDARCTHVAADLLDRADCDAKLGGLAQVTHLFHAAYAERPTLAELCEPNRAMLANALEAIEPAASGLQHVHIMQGTKYYGSHLGPFKTPAKESDARHLPPNFYYDLQDYVVGRQQGKAWSWSAARPHAVIGFALGNPMNLSTVIAVYASICKELGVPLAFPGAKDAYSALYQCTDAELLARAMVWMATSPACANEAFNITNGDLIRWENAWPRFAQAFGIEPGAPRRISLAQTMADKAPLWQAIVEKHRLKPYRYAEIVSWRYGDFVFATDYDVISDMGKARRYGFCESLDTERRFLEIFESYRRERIIP